MVNLFKFCQNQFFIKEVYLPPIFSNQKQKNSETNSYSTTISKIINDIQMKKKMFYFQDKLKMISSKNYPLFKILFLKINVN